jgi:hypothetical protein
MSANSRSVLNPHLSPSILFLASTLATSGPSTSSARCPRLGVEVSTFTAMDHGRDFATADALTAHSAESIISLLRRITSTHGKPKAVLTPWRVRREGYPRERGRQENRSYHSGKAKMQNRNQLCVLLIEVDIRDRGCKKRMETRENEVCKQSRTEN